MSKGKRYNKESKLNIKKVIAVIIAMIVIVMFVIGLQKLLGMAKDNKNAIASISYYPVYTNGKWGVIDSNGTIIIEPTMEELITIPDNKTDLFICTYDVDYTNQTYQTKVLNAKQKELFEKYDLVEAIENHDKNNILWYEEGVLKVKKGNKYGLINYAGKEMLPVEYDEIQALEGVKNSLLLLKEDKLGLCDNKGRIVINPEYEEIQAINEEYQNGYIVSKNQGQYGIMDFNGKVILETKYEKIKQITGNNKYVVTKDGKTIVIDKDENIIINGGFDDIVQINKDNMIFVKNNKYGAFNTQGEQIIKPEYQELSYTFGDYYIAKNSGKYGIITQEEVKVPFEYASISYRKGADFLELEKANEMNTIVLNSELEKVVEGIISEVNLEKGYLRIRVGDEYKYYNVKFEEKTAQEILTNNTLFLSKKDGKYGYVDKEGNVVVDYIYEDGLEQNEFGYVAVKKDGKWGALDKTGTQVAENKYELDNNVIINFIGKWHLAEDLNSNYYTD